MLEALGDALLGDFVEQHSGEAVRLNSQLLGDVPRDGFPFAIRVERQVDRVHLTRGFLELAQDLFLAGNNAVLRQEILVDIHAHLGLWQVLDVPERRLYRVGPAEVLSDGLGLGRRFHNYKRFGHLSSSSHITPP